MDFVSALYVLPKDTNGTQKTPGIHLLKMCIYSYMFKLQSPSKYSPFDAVHLMRHFFHCSKQFLNMLILMPFSAFATFCFTSFMSAKHFPSCTFLIQGNKWTKEVIGGERGWIGRVGYGGHAILGQKLLNTQCGMGRCGQVNNPSWNGQMHWVFKNNSLKLNAACHNTTS